MSYESAAGPIKLGYLMDFVLPDEYPEDQRLDLTQSLELIFERRYRDGVIDRPVEIVYKEVEGLPKGSAKAVIARTQRRPRRKARRYDRYRDADRERGPLRDRRPQRPAQLARSADHLAVAGLLLSSS